MLNNTEFNSTAESSSEKPFYHVYRLISVILPPSEAAILLFGLVSNTINVIVFLKTGVKDNVTTLLLSLSVSDATYLILTTPIISTMIIIYLVPDWPWPFDYNITSSLLYWPSMTIYNFSSFISVFLGLVRCACVAMPLHFKSVFTKSRTVKIVVLLFFVSLALHAPVLTIFKITFKFNPLRNTTFAQVSATNRLSMVKVNDLLNRNSVPLISFIIMIACVAVLSFKLIQSSRLRSSHKNSSKQGPNVTNSNKSRNQDKADAQKMSEKDIHVVQSVLLVCTIFIFSQLIFVIGSTVRLINPEFDQTGRLQNLFFISAHFNNTLTLLNCSINIFVYYNYNTKYRTGFRALFFSKEEV
ncbi:chemosensory receptor b [Plakobranchus ocellatus]|uniref:Chemosensory receptor b n=1 Tax=Plakobranchus ocellatus TaxID=259542 RepID=A0AAV4ASG5_9GAST|nr:chemosensory receptor b [Plakobranchus ocellatus]